MSENEKEFLKEANAIENVYDEQSLKNSISAWKFLNKQNKINPPLILQIHKILMNDINAWSEPKLLPKYKGIIRDCDIYINGKKGMNPMAIPDNIKQWCKDMNNKDFTNVIFTKILHIDYEHIHPFVDGNGRTGRMFMNWWRIKNNLPILIIKENEKQEYYKWFK